MEPTNEYFDRPSTLDDVVAGLGRVSDQVNYLKETLIEELRDRHQAQDIAKLLKCVGERIGDTNANILELRHSTSKLAESMYDSQNVLMRCTLLIAILLGLILWRVW